MVFTIKQIRENRKTWINDGLLAKTPKGNPKYRQHRGQLASCAYRSFCCLGVACETVSALKVVRGFSGNYIYDNNPDYHPVLIECVLRREQAEALGLSSKCQDWLSSLNDDRRVPFSVIAVIVRQLPIMAYEDPFDYNLFEHLNQKVRQALDPYQKWYE